MRAALAGIAPRMHAGKAHHQSALKGDGRQIHNLYLDFLSARWRDGQDKKTVAFRPGKQNKKHKSARVTWLSGEINVLSIVC